MTQATLSDHISELPSRGFEKSLAFAICGALFMCAPLAAHAAPTCTATGFVRDSINLTAARINPSGTVSGDLDATGCNIGVYYGAGRHGQVNDANIHGANYFGVVNNGADVDIKNSNISEIGEKPFNGAQHGAAIYFVYGTNARGDIRGNYIWDYQKGGIVVNGNADNTDIAGNTVIGLGPVNFIAQNGIQVGDGANAHVWNNTVTGNSYTGPNLASSGGILVVGGPYYGVPYTTKVVVEDNTLLANDVGIFLVNYDASGNPPTTPTRNEASNNTIVNNAVNNTTGDGPTQGYQAGILDTGDFDVIESNDICGPGYKPPGTASAALFAIDTTFTNNPKVKGNTTCATHWFEWWAATPSARHAAAAVARKAQPTR